MLVIRRIHVTYHLKAPADKREIVERVMGFHADSCPVYRSISGCIGITTALAMEGE